MKTPDMNEFVNAIGALAELQALYYNNLIKAGVPSEAATEMSIGYTKLMFDIMGGNQ